MVVIGLLAAGLAAAADCSPSATDLQRAACLRVELDAADQTINTTYAALRSRLDDPGKLALRDAQRAWIRRRDQVCNLGRSDGDRAAWLASLSEDFAKTVCVVRFTNERVAELKTQLGRAPGGSAAPSPATAAPAPAPPPADQPAVYDLRAQTPRTTGKWYFETALKIGALVASSEQAIFVGLKDANGHGLGTLQTVRRGDAGRENRNIGVAVDLEAGKLYLRFNGAWADGAPGSSGGLDLKLGRPYLAWTSSSAALDQALRTQAIEANFGQRPFAYALPDGYLPMDTAGPIPIVDRQP